MNVEQRMSQVLTKKLGYYISTNEIGHETLWLYKDELDQSMVDESILEQLDETVIAHSAGYEAEDGVYYLMLQIQLVTGAFHEVWLVNEQVAPNFTQRRNEEC